MCYQENIRTECPNCHKHIETFPRKVFCSEARRKNREYGQCSKGSKVKDDVVLESECEECKLLREAKEADSTPDDWKRKETFDPYGDRSEGGYYTW